MRDNQENCPVIRLETRSHNITFEPETVRLIGEPRHVEFFWDGDKQRLCIAMTQTATRYSTKLPPLSKLDPLRPSIVAEPELVRFLADAFGWEKNRCYEAKGSFDEQTKLAVFELSDAAETGGWENAF